jgi:hypothetical protein
MVRLGRTVLAVAAVLALGGAVHGVLPARAQTAACAIPVLSLEQITQQSTTAVIALVTAERGDPVDGYASTLKIEGALKGLPPGPAIRLDGLGHPNGDCSGGPRLVAGPLYVLFLTKLDGAPAGQASYALTDSDESVYTLTSNGAIFPADKEGGSPQLQPVAPAEFARDVGTLAGTDPARIENLIAALALPTTIGGTSGSAIAAPSGGGAPRWLPSHAAIVGVGIGALTLALLLLVLWQPREPRPR